MNDAANRRYLARGEAKSKIHWGADVQEVLGFLRTNYGIQSEEADAMIADAVRARRGAIRKKAAIHLVFGAVGLAVSIAYFTIQGLVGFVVIGFGPVLMASLGVVSLWMAGRSVYRLVTGKASGPA